MTTFWVSDISKLVAGWCALRSHWRGRCRIQGIATEYKTSIRPAEMILSMAKAANHPNPT